MNIRFVVFVLAALTVPLAPKVSRDSPVRGDIAAAPPASTAPSPAPSPHLDPGRVLMPRETWSSAMDARALAADDTFVWVATGGGLDRYSRTSREHRHFGTADGLDTLDIRDVEASVNGVIVRTGTSRCLLATAPPRFTCAPSVPAPARPRDLELFRGIHPVAARLSVGADTYVATRGGGAFFVPGGDASKAMPLAAEASGPSSFVHTAAVFRGALWLGTFEDGLYRAPLDANGRLAGSLATTARPVASPARLVNRVIASAGPHAALFVGASDGLFVTRDGARFARVSALAAHAITGLATTKRHLWVSSTEALYRLPLTGRGRVERSFVYPGGSHAIQALAVGEDGVAWLATEDRGVVRVDTRAKKPATAVRAFDRLAGLPTSWFVAVDSDGAGGVIATSLRHGPVHLTSDGTWSTIEGAPSPWGLAVRRDGETTCLGTQGGASCEANGQRVSLGALPDPRVHVFFPLRDVTLVGTEAGAALYAL
jgi:hypothetical protein